MRTEYKPNWQDFKTVLEEGKIKKLYHFTDRENISSIKSNGGLYSWSAAELNNISIAKPGGIGFGRTLDKMKGLENYVRLSFTVSNPMVKAALYEARISDPVYLEINTEVIFYENTLFTEDNATKNGIFPCSSLECFKRIATIDKQSRLYIIAAKFGNHLFINSKAEILVHEKIPLELINNINSI